MPYVHLCDWSSQPDIRIACDQSWTTPRIEHFDTTGEKVFRAVGGRLYTFENEFVTCPKCKEKI